MDLAPRYNIRTNIQDGVLTVEFFGFWDVSTAGKFVGDLQMALNTLDQAGFGPDKRVLIVDLQHSDIQSQVIVDSFKGFAATFGAGMRRIAVLNRNTLQMMQTKRIAESYHHYKFFLPDDHASAYTWVREY